MKMTNLPRMGLEYYANIFNRQSSFIFRGSSILTGIISSQDFASAGLLYVGPGDRLMCFACGGVLENWKPEDNPRMRHANSFPDCWYVKSGFKEPDTSQSTIPRICSFGTNNQSTDGSTPMFHSNSLETLFCGANATQPVSNNAFASFMINGSTSSSPAQSSSDFSFSSGFGVMPNNPNERTNNSTATPGGFRTSANSKVPNNTGLFQQLSFRQPQHQAYSSNRQSGSSFLGSYNIRVPGPFFWTTCTTSNSSNNLPASFFCSSSSNSSFGSTPGSIFDSSSCSNSSTNIPWTVATSSSTSVPKTLGFGGSNSSGGTAFPFGIPNSSGTSAAPKPLTFGIQGSSGTSAAAPNPPPFGIPHSSSTSENLEPKPFPFGIPDSSGTSAVPKPPAFGIPHSSSTSEDFPKTLFSFGTSSSSGCTSAVPKSFGFGMSRHHSASNAESSTGNKPPFAFFNDPSNSLPALFGQWREPQHQSPLTSDTIENAMKSNIVLPALEAGFTRGQIKAAMEKKLKECDTLFSDSNSLVDAILLHQEEHPEEANAMPTNSSKIPLRVIKEIPNATRKRPLSAARGFTNANTFIPPNQNTVLPPENVIMSSPIVSKALEAGFNRYKIYSAIQWHFNQHGSMFDSPDSLLQFLRTDETAVATNNSTANLAEKSGKSNFPSSPLPGKRNTNVPADNTNQREVGTCKICLEDEIEVLFRPCGHLACCLKCSKTFRDCPLCRRHIKEKVRVYLS